MARPEQMPGSVRLQNRLTTVFERDFRDCSNPCLVPEAPPFPLLSLSGCSTPVCIPTHSDAGCRLRPVQQSSVGKFLSVANLNLTSSTFTYWLCCFRADGEQAHIAYFVLERSPLQLVLSTNYSSKGFSSNHTTTLILFFLDPWLSTWVTHLEMVSSCHEKGRGATGTPASGQGCC